MDKLLKLSDINTDDLIQFDLEEIINCFYETTDIGYSYSYMESQILDSEGKLKKTIRKVRKSAMFPPDNLVCFLLRECIASDNN